MGVLPYNIICNNIQEGSKLSCTILLKSYSQQRAVFGKSWPKRPCRLHEVKRFFCRFPKFFHIFICFLFTPVAFLTNILFLWWLLTHCIKVKVLRNPENPWTQGRDVSQYATYWYKVNLVAFICIFIKLYMWLYEVREVVHETTECYYHCYLRRRHFLYCAR